MVDFEDNVTHRLRGLLHSRGLDVDSRAKAGRGRADLITSHEQGKIAAECELDGPGKKKQAVKDAVKRLTPARHADVAIAVVYPPRCSEKSLRHGTRLRVSIVDDYVARPKQEHLILDAGGPGTPAGANARARWMTCTGRGPTAFATRTRTSAIPARSSAGSATQPTRRRAGSWRPSAGRSAKAWGGPRKGDSGRRRGAAPGERSRAAGSLYGPAARTRAGHLARRRDPTRADTGRRAAAGGRRPCTAAPPAPLPCPHSSYAVPRLPPPWTRRAARGRSPVTAAALHRAAPLAPPPAA